MNIVFLGIGSNLGNREVNLKKALSEIEEKAGKVVRASSVYETEPWGFNSDSNFLNMVIEVETKLTPSGLLGAILMIEVQLGRVRSESQYASRVIDIDILFYNGLIIDNVTLKIPHPHLHERKFVLVPLCEIAHELIHPVIKKSIGTILESCKDKSEVRLQDRKTARPQDN